MRSSSSPVTFRARRATFLRCRSTSDEPIERSLLGQIEYLIRSHFERVERQLKALDTSGQGKISADQWKVFLEDLIEFALSPDEFHRLKKSFPRDPAGQILWKDFLRQIRKSSSDDHRQVLDSPSKSLSLSLLSLVSSVDGIALPSRVV